MKRLTTLLLLLSLCVCAKDKPQQPQPINAEDRARLMQTWLDLAAVEAQFSALQRRYSELTSKFRALSADLRRTYQAPDSCTPVLDRDESGLTTGVKWQCLTETPKEK